MVSGGRYPRSLAITLTWKPLRVSSAAVVRPEYPAPTTVTEVFLPMMQRESQFSNWKHLNQVLIYLYVQSVVQYQILCNLIWPQNSFYLEITMNTTFYCCTPQEGNQDLRIFFSTFSFNKSVGYNTYMEKFQYSIFKEAYFGDKLIFWFPDFFHMNESKLRITFYKPNLIFVYYVCMSLFVFSCGDTLTPFSLNLKWSF